MLEERFDDQLRDAARDYNSPPETPREAMWERIVAARTGKAMGEETEGTAAERDVTEKVRTLPFRFFRPVRRSTFRPFRLGAGIAALLALGIGLGRLTAPDPDSPVKVAEAPTKAPPQVSDVAYRVVTTEHLSQSEAFLTLFRASVHRAADERLSSSTARQLLATNRLLLDSPAGSDSRTRLLLQDLELVLAQIAQLSGRPSAPDLDLITNGLEDSGVMSRLRTAVPSGTSPTQGVL